MKPSEVNSENEQLLLDTVYNYKRIVTTRALSRQMSKFKVGDYVRLSKHKTVFEKGYTPNWTAEIFKVVKVQNHTHPITYLIGDINDKEVKGCVYGEELQQVKYPDVYLVEKIIRKRNGRAFVKWLGFGPEHNSWISEEDII